jgi:hypothetical protein
MESIDYFYKDLKDQPGGILIVDTINNMNIIVLGKSNVPKRMKEYESFGGKVEKVDISSLHTAVREFIEEFFNIKTNIESINTIAYKIREKELILKQYEFFGMAYLINLNGLNEIFQMLCESYNSLSKYNINNKFDLENYINDRVITESPNKGLNEIKSLHIINLEDIKEKKIKLRWYTNKIISKMLKF